MLCEISYYGASNTHELQFGYGLKYTTSQYLSMCLLQLIYGRWIENRLVTDPYVASLLDPIGSLDILGIVCLFDSFSRFNQD